MWEAWQSLGPCLSCFQAGLLSTDGALNLPPLLLPLSMTLKGGGTGSPGTAKVLSVGLANYMPGGPNPACVLFFCGP